MQASMVASGDQDTRDLMIKEFSQDLLKYKDRCTQLEKLLSTYRATGSFDASTSEINKLREENNKFKMMLFKIKNKDKEGRTQRRVQIFGSAEDRSLHDVLYRTVENSQMNDITTVSNKQGLKQQKTLYHNDDVDRPLVMMSTRF